MEERYIIVGAGHLRAILIHWSSQLESKQIVTVLSDAEI